jgi:hypothetical protein
MQSNVLIAAIIALVTMGLEPAVATPDRAAGIRTAGDLLAACALARDESPEAGARQAGARRFCHGFLLGVLAWPPDGRQPTGRTCEPPLDWRDALAGYAAWVHANPIHLDDNPARSLVEFLDLHGLCRR